MPRLTASLVLGLLLGVTVLLPVGPVSAGDIAPGEPSVSGTRDLLGGRPAHGRPTDVARRLARTSPPADSVVVATAHGSADALAAAPLLAGGPLLLVDARLTSADLAVVDDVGARTAILLGGVDAVPEEAAVQLREAGLQVQRIGGTDRVSTAVDIARETAPSADTAVLVRGAGMPGAADPSAEYADSLAAGGLAATMGWPVLLTGGDALPDATADHLATSAVRHVVVVGGQRAIPEAVVEALPQGVRVTRLDGPDRVGTALAVDRFRTEVSGVASEVVVVDDRSWVPGIAAAARAATADATILLSGWSAASAPVDVRLSELAAGGTSLACATARGICERSRIAMGMPARALVVTTPPPGDAVGATIELTAVDRALSAEVGGTCVEAKTIDVERGASTTLAVRPDRPDVSCTVEVVVTLSGGVVQREVWTYPTTPARRPIPADGEALAVEMREGDWLLSGRPCQQMLDPRGREVPCDQAHEALLDGPYLITWQPGGGLDVAHVRPVVDTDDVLSVEDQIATVVLLDLAPGDRLQYTRDGTFGSFDIALLDPDGVRQPRISQPCSPGDSCVAIDVTRPGRHILVSRPFPSTTGGLGITISRGAPLPPEGATFDLTVRESRTLWWQGSAGEIATFATGSECPRVQFQRCASLAVTSPEGQRVATVDPGVQEGYVETPPVRLPVTGIYRIDLRRGSQSDSAVAVQAVTGAPVVEVPSTEPTSGLHLRAVQGTAGEQLRATLSGIAQPSSERQGCTVAIHTADGERLSSFGGCADGAEAVADLPYTGTYLVTTRIAGEEATLELVTGPRG